MIKYNANGFTNWIRFRNKILYILNKDAAYRAEPIDMKKKKQKTEDDISPMKMVTKSKFKYQKKLTSNKNGI